MGWPRIPSCFDKVESFTVAADRDQADRWGAAAAERCMEVVSWLADTADAHLRERARTGQAPPLFWFRDRFLVTMTDTTRRPEVVSEVVLALFNRSRLLEIPPVGTPARALITLWLRSREPPLPIWTPDVAPMPGSTTWPVPEIFGQRPRWPSPGC